MEEQQNLWEEGIDEIDEQDILKEFANLYENDAEL